MYNEVYKFKCALCLVLQSTTEGKNMEKLFSEMPQKFNYSCIKRLAKDVFLDYLFMSSSLVIFSFSVTSALRIFICFTLI